MLFGLCNAPATFQRLMNKVFADNIGKFIAVYLDDILIFSRNFDEHWQRLWWALEKLREAKLYGRLHKCEFLKDQVDYLGFKVSPGGIKASPGKIRAVIEWPKPKSVHNVCHAFVDSVVFLVTPCEFPIFLNIGHMRQGRLLSDGGPKCHKNTHRIGGSRQ